MKILITGASGYIGSRLLPVLAESGHEIIALVRKSHLKTVPQHLHNKVTVLVGDLLDEHSIPPLPTNIDVAYYLVHSMGDGAPAFTRQKLHLQKPFSNCSNKRSASRSSF